MSSIESAVKSVSENNVVIKPTGILKVGNNPEQNIKKKTRFAEVEERIIIQEGLDLLKKYKAYLTFNDNLDKMKETTIQPGIFLSFDKKFNVWAWVVHAKEESETICFNHIEHANKVLIEKFTNELSDHYYELFQRDIDRPGELFLKQLVLKNEILEIIANNTRYKKITRFTADVIRTVMKQEREDLFLDYTWTLTLSRKLDDIKTATRSPGFYIYRDKDGKVYVLVKHSKEETETICLSDIAQTAEDQIYVIEAVKMLNDGLLGGISLRSYGLQEFQLKSNLLDLIKPHCEKCLIKIPFSHDELHPLHVFEFSMYNKTNDFVETYFFEESIRYTINREDYFLEENGIRLFAQQDMEDSPIEIRSLFVEENPPLLSDYDKEDMCIFFLDQNTPQELLKQLDEATKKGLRVVGVKVTDNAHQIGIKSIIAKIQEVYTVPNEEPVIAEFKAKLAKRALGMTIAGRLCNGKQQKTILSELIQMYIIANTGSERSLKQEFLGYMDLWKSEVRENSKKSGKSKKSEEKILEEIVQKVKELYISSYHGYQVQILETRKEKEPLPIDEPTQSVWHDTAAIGDEACMTKIAQHNSVAITPMPLEVDGSGSSGSDQREGQVTAFPFWSRPQPIDAPVVDVPEVIIQPT